MCALDDAHDDGGGGGGGSSLQNAYGSLPSFISAMLIISII